MATEKQVSYAMRLLSENGYSTRYMDSSYKALGATMRERSGSVEEWLRAKNSAEISSLITSLQRTARPAQSPQSQN